LHNITRGEYDLLATELGLEGVADVPPSKPTRNGTHVSHSSDEINEILKGGDELELTTDMKITVAEFLAGSYIYRNGNR
jgi:hypothetical protein